MDVANIPRMKEDYDGQGLYLHCQEYVSKLENPKHFGLPRPSHRAQNTHLTVGRLIRSLLYRR